MLKGDDDEVARLVKLEAQPSEDEQKVSRPLPRIAQQRTPTDQITTQSSSRQASTTAARSANAPIIDQLKLARDRITMFQTDVFLHRATQQSWELVKEAVLEVFEMMDRFNGDGHDEVLALIIDTDRLIKPVKPAF